MTLPNELEPLGLSDLDLDDPGPIVIHKAIPGPLPKTAMCGFVIDADNSAGVVEQMTDPMPPMRCERCDVLFLEKSWNLSQ